MRQLTMQEVREKHGGILPADAVLIADAKPSIPQRRKQKSASRGNRFTTLNTFTDMAIQGLTGAAVKVWLILFRDTKAATGTARTGQTDIARRAGLTVRGVQKILKQLEREGMLKIVHRGRLNGGPSVYRVFPTGVENASP